MIKISLIAASVLAISGSVAFAQMPAGPGTAPGGADGPTPTRNVGNTSATAKDLGTGQTQSSTMLMQQIKSQSQAGNAQTPVGGYNGSVGLGAGADANPQVAGAGATYRGRRIAITDEYGFKYDEQGQRIR